MTSAPPSQHFVFGKASALAEFFSSCGTMASPRRSTSVRQRRPSGLRSEGSCTSSSCSCPGGHGAPRLQSLQPLRGLSGAHAAGGDFTLTFAEALKVFFDDNTSWRSDLEAFDSKASNPWADSLHRFLSELRAVAEAVHTPNLQEGDKGERYPFLGRAIKLGDDQHFLKKRMLDGDNMGMHHF